MSSLYQSYLKDPIVLLIYYEAWDRQESHYHHHHHHHHHHNHHHDYHHHSSTIISTYPKPMPCYFSHPEQHPHPVLPRRYGYLTYHYTPSSAPTTPTMRARPPLDIIRITLHMSSFQGRRIFQSPSVAWFILLRFGTRLDIIFVVASTWTSSWQWLSWWWHSARLLWWRRR